METFSTARLVRLAGMQAPDAENVLSDVALEAGTA